MPRGTTILPTASEDHSPSANAGQSSAALTSP